MQNSVAPVAAVSTQIAPAPDVEPPAHGRVEQPGLRAEVAVLGAAAGLDRDDALDLDIRAAPAHTYLVGELEQLGDVVVGKREDVQHLVLVKASTVLEHLGTSGREEVGGVHGHKPSPTTDVVLTTSAPNSHPLLEVFGGSVVTSGTSGLDRACGGSLPHRSGRRRPDPGR